MESPFLELKILQTNKLRPYNLYIPQNWFDTKILDRIYNADLILWDKVICSIFFFKQQKKMRHKLVVSHKLVTQVWNWFGWEPCGCYLLKYFPLENVTFFFMVEMEYGYWNRCWWWTDGQVEQPGGQFLKG